MSKYDQYYVPEVWDKLPDCRIHLDLDDGGERLWGKVLPDGTFAINNLPLDGRFQWMDIVRTKNIRSTEDLIHRHWKLKLYYLWDEPTFTDAMPKRREILDALKSNDLHPGFFCRNVGYALFTSDDVQASKQRLIDTLAKVGVTASFETT